jgi:hypothetical protein
MKTNLLLILSFLVSMSCSTSPDSNRAGSSRDIITAEEISSTGALTAYDAVMHARPNFLKSRGPKSVTGKHDERSMSYPAIYLNGMFYGEMERLKEIHAQDVREIRYLDPSSAGLQFGLGNTAGAILVKTK